MRNLIAAPSKTTSVRSFVMGNNFDKIDIPQSKLRKNKYIV